jgi:predicted XRE-type DNA-binding protein
MKTGTTRNNTQAKMRVKQTAEMPVVEVEASSGNVFADLRLAKPHELLAKAELVRRICEVIAERKLTQAKAAEILHLDQPKVSALLRGNFRGFSTDRLFKLLNTLGQEVTIIVRPVHEPGCHADTHVVTA